MDGVGLGVRVGSNGVGVALGVMASLTAALFATTGRNANSGVGVGSGESDRTCGESIAAETAPKTRSDNATIANNTKYLNCPPPGRGFPFATVRPRPTKKERRTTGVRPPRRNARSFTWAPLHKRIFRLHLGDQLPAPLPQLLVLELETGRLPATDHLADGVDEAGGHFRYDAVDDVFRHLLVHEARQDIPAYEHDDD